MSFIGIIASLKTCDSSLSCITDSIKAFGVILLRFKIYFVKVPLMSISSAVKYSKTDARNTEDVFETLYPRLFNFLSIFATGNTNPAL